MRRSFSARIPHAIVAVVLGAGSMGCATAANNQPPEERQLAQAISPPERLRPAEPLSNTARAILKTRMASHAREMNELVSEIMLLHYDRIRDDAERIASDANLSRPLTQDATELNSALPEKFFLYDDSLRLEARTLAEAAERQHPYDVADSYGRLSQVCVRCHATYRTGR